MKNGKVENKEIPKIEDTQSEESFLLRQFSGEKLKQKAAKLAGTLFVTAGLGMALTGCGSHDKDTKKVDCKANPEADSCIDDGYYNHSSSSFIWFGGMYHSNNGVYHSPTTSDRSYNGSMGKSYSSSKAGSVSG